MPISADCPDCFRSYEVPSKYEGKSIRCKSCGAAIRVEKAYRDTIDEDDAFGPQWVDDRETRANRKRQSRSLPFWIPVAISAGILLVMVLVALFSPIAALILAVLAIGMGCLALFVGKIVLMVESSREDSTQALLVFFVPFYSLFYQISRWPSTRTSVQVMTIGLMGIAVGPLILFAAVSAAGGNDPFDNLGKNRVARNGNQPGGNQQAFPGPAGWPGRGGPPGNPADRLRDLRQRHRQGPPDDFGPPQPGFPFKPRFPNDPAAAADPTTATWYLTDYNNSFNRNEDHLAELERYLATQRGYIPGSVKLDLKAGTFAFSYDQSQARRLDQMANWALLRIGLRAEKERPVEPWVAPGATKTLVYNVVGVMQAQQDRFQGGIREAVDGALSRHGLRRGYVPGSVKVDETNGKITFKCKAPFMSESAVWVALASVGFRVEKAKTTP